MGRREGQKDARMDEAVRHVDGSLFSLRIIALRAEAQSKVRDLDV